MAVYLFIIYFKVSSADTIQKDEVVHEENDWGISLVDETSNEGVSTQAPSQPQLAEGLQVYSHIFPSH